jgi:UDP-N-acetylglucosamine--N-acetylmuramyl-(pentapeptide) pyrophosphoryl-undecaprenol N-acetylglucosamine transferase
VNARSYFQLDPQLPTLLIFGGSQGAKAINDLLRQGIKKGLFQVIHFTGDEFLAKELQDFYDHRGIRAKVKGFEKQMDQAWEAADLFISRAGASTISEAFEYEVPGIFIPYPHATDNHQDKNADFFVEQVKGGTKLNEATLTPMQLMDEIERLLVPTRLQEKRESIQHYKQTSSRQELAEFILSIL